MIARPITTILHAWRVARAVLVLAGCRFAWPRVTPWEDAPEWQKTSVRNGVLTLQVPKREQAKPRRIEIKAE